MSVEEKARLWATGWLLEFGSGLIPSDVYFRSEWFTSPAGKAIYDPGVQDYVNGLSDFGNKSYTGRIWMWGLGPGALRLIGGSDD